jgi:heme/copper-type cytochrome/quinol oxidase subunit 3
MPIEPELPEVLGANINIGARLLASAIAFFFMAFVFAFLYLRALNTAHSFREPHVTPPIGWGVAILVCVIGATAVFTTARTQLGDGSASGWRTGSLVALLLALAATVLQLIEYYNLHFGATSGGLASVFFGYTAMFTLFWLGIVYWVETLWAQSLRGERPGGASDIASPWRTLRPNAGGCVINMIVLSVTEIFAFVLLYLVK